MYTIKCDGDLFTQNLKREIDITIKKSIVGGYFGKLQADGAFILQYRGVEKNCFRLCIKGVIYDNYIEYELDRPLLSIICRNLLFGVFVILTVCLIISDLTNGGNVMNAMKSLILLVVPLLIYGGSCLLYDARDKEVLIRKIEELSSSV